jgi:hypothetical protein
MAKVKVYYNSACPVCNAGITGQRERMAGCGTDVDWIDIHRDAKAANEIGAEREFVRERLHVVDESGKVRIGAEAFEALGNRLTRRRPAQWNPRAGDALLQG